MCSYVTLFEVCNICNIQVLRQICTGQFSKEATPRLLRLSTYTDIYKQVTNIDVITDFIRVYNPDTETERCWFVIFEFGMCFGRGNKAGGRYNHTY